MQPIDKPRKKRAKGNKRNRRPISPKKLAFAREYAGKAVSGKTDRDCLLAAGYRGHQKQATILKNDPLIIAEIAKIKAADTKAVRKTLDEIIAGIEAIADGQEPSEIIRTPDGTTRKFELLGARIKLLNHLAPPKAKIEHTGKDGAPLIPDYSKFSDEQLANYRELVALLHGVTGTGTD